MKTTNILDAPGIRDSLYRIFLAYANFPGRQDPKNIGKTVGAILSFEWEVLSLFYEEVLSPGDRLKIDPDIDYRVMTQEIKIAPPDLRLTYERLFTDPNDMPNHPCTATGDVTKHQARFISMLKGLVLQGHTLSQEDAIFPLIGLRNYIAKDIVFLGTDSFWFMQVPAYGDLLINYDAEAFDRVLRGFVGYSFVDFILRYERGRLAKCAQCGNFHTRRRAARPGVNVFCSVECKDQFHRAKRSREKFHRKYMQGYRKL